MGLWWARMKALQHSNSDSQTGGRIRRRVHLLAQLDQVFHERIQPMGYVNLTEYIHEKIRTDAGLRCAHTGPRHG